MTLTKKEVNDICLYCNVCNNGEALNGDDIEQIEKALKEFNGD